MWHPGRSDAAIRTAALSLLLAELQVSELAAAELTADPEKLLTAVVGKKPALGIVAATGEVWGRLLEAGGYQVIMQSYDLVMKQACFRGELGLTMQSKDIASEYFAHNHVEVSMSSILLCFHHPTW